MSEQEQSELMQITSTEEPVKAQVQQYVPSAEVQAQVQQYVPSAEVQAQVSQALRWLVLGHYSQVRQGFNEPQMSPYMQESIIMLCMNLAAISNGNCENINAWKSINAITAAMIETLERK